MNVFISVVASPGWVLFVLLSWIFFKIFKWFLESLDHKGSGVVWVCHLGVRHFQFIYQPPANAAGLCQAFPIYIDLCATDVPLAEFAFLIRNLCPRRRCHFAKTVTHGRKICKTWPFLVQASSSLNERYIRCDTQGHHILCLLSRIVE